MDSARVKRSKHVESQKNHADIAGEVPGSLPQVDGHSRCSWPHSLSIDNCCRSKVSQTLVSQGAPLIAASTFLLLLPQLLFPFNSHQQPLSSIIMASEKQKVRPIELSPLVFAHWSLTMRYVQHGITKIRLSGICYPPNLDWSYKTRQLKAKCLSIDVVCISRAC